MFKLAALGFAGLLISAFGVRDGQSLVKTDLEVVGRKTPLGREVITFLHEWRTDLLSRDPGRLARHSAADSRRAVRRQLQDRQSNLYGALYFGLQSVERVIKSLPDSRIVAFVHRMNDEGTSVLGCYERTAGALTVPPPSYVELMKRYDAKDVFCLGLIKDENRWTVDYTFANDDDSR